MQSGRDDSRGSGPVVARRKTDMLVNERTDVRRKIHWIRRVS